MEKHLAFNRQWQPKGKATILISNSKKPKCHHDEAMQRDSPFHFFSILMARSCEQCRKKKRKCDGARPICSLCQRTGQSCIYLGIPKPPKGEKPLPIGSKKYGIAPSSAFVFAGQSPNGHHPPPSSITSPTGSSPPYQPQDPARDPSLFNLLGVGTAERGTARYAEAQLVIDTVLNFRSLAQQGATNRTDFIRKIEVLDSHLNARESSSVSSGSSRHVYTPEYKSPGFSDSGSTTPPENFMDVETAMNNTSIYNHSFMESSSASRQRSAEPSQQTWIPNSDFLVQYRATFSCVVLHLRSVVLNFDKAADFLRTVLYSLELEYRRLPVRDRQLYDTARSLAYSAIETPSLEVLQSLILLFSCALAMGKFNAHFRFVEMALQMANMLELNIDPNELEVMRGIKISWVEKECLRRCWWSCFVIEKLRYISFGMPPTLKPTNNVRPICNDDFWNSMEDPNTLEPHYNQFHSDNYESYKNPMNSFAELLTLADNANQTCLEKTIKMGDQKIIEFMSGLDDWKQCLPPSCQIVLNDDWFANAMNKEIGPPWCLIQMTLYYHHFLVFVHRPLALEKVYAKSHPHAAGQACDDTDSVATRLGLSSCAPQRTKVILFGANGRFDNWSPPARAQVEASYAIVRASVERVGRICRHICNSYSGEVYIGLLHPLYQINTSIIMLACDAGPYGHHPDPIFRQQCIEWLLAIKAVALGIKAMDGITRYWCDALGAVASWLSGTRSLRSVIAEFEAVVTTVMQFDNERFTMDLRLNAIKDTEDIVYILRCSAMEEESNAADEKQVTPVPTIEIDLNGILGNNSLDGNLNIIDELFNLDWRTTNM